MVARSSNPKEPAVPALLVQWILRASGQVVNLDILQGSAFPMRPALFGQRTFAAAPSISRNRCANTLDSR